MDWFRITSKVLVWLLAASIPLQGLPDTSCGCAFQAKPTVDADGTSLQHIGCCCHHASQPAEPATARHACCRHADSDVPQTTCHCRANCRCKKTKPAPSPKQVPPKHRTQSNDQTVGSSISFCVDNGDAEMMETKARKVTFLAGADRCILLCRFHL